jgi:hypothetical protein
MYYETHILYIFFCLLFFFCQNKIDVNFVFIYLFHFQSLYICYSCFDPYSDFNIFVIYALTAWPLPKILSGSVPDGMHFDDLR